MPNMSQGYRSIFSGENITVGTYAYAGKNAQNVIKHNTYSSAAMSGWLNGKYNQITLQWNVATLARSGNVQVRVEGRLSPNNTRPASITTKTFTTPAGIDIVYNFANPKVSQYRVGIRSSITPASPLASPCNVYISALLNEAA